MCLNDFFFIAILSLANISERVISNKTFLLLVNISQSSSQQVREIIIIMESAGSLRRKCFSISQSGKFKNRIKNRIKITDDIWISPLSLESPTNEVWHFEYIWKIK